MGTPLPPNVAGVRCPNCWGPGKPFGTGATPEFITLHFTGFSQGSLWLPQYEDVLNAPHLLTQTVQRCTWLVFDPFFSWLLRFEGVLPRIVIRLPPIGALAAVNVASPHCQSIYESDLDTPTNNVAFGGQISVSWNTGGL